MRREGDSGEVDAAKKNGTRDGNESVPRPEFVENETDEGDWYTHT